jgi:hypothetical protein
MCKKQGNHGPTLDPSQFFVHTYVQVRTYLPYQSKILNNPKNYQLKTPPPAVYKTSGMSPSPQKKKQTSSGKEIAADFLSRTVNQVSTHICGTPTTQKAALSVLEDLAKSDNNISKLNISSKAANGAATYAMLKKVSLLLLQSKKITMSM